MAPELVEAFVDEFRKELNRIAAERANAAVTARRALDDVNCRIDGIVKAIEDGAYNPTLGQRLTELENRKKTLEHEVPTLRAETDIRLHPNLAKVYRGKVAKLEEALNAADSRTEAGDILRGLIDEIVLTPSEDGTKAELTGDLAAILTLCNQKSRRPGAVASGRQLSVVAGTRSHDKRARHERATI